MNTDLQSGRTKQRVLAIVIGALLASGTAAAIAMREPAPAAEKPRPAPGITVNVITPVHAAFDRAIAATGTVRAKDELVIGSDASGVRLLEVLVDVGSVVRPGELLARADDATLRAQLAQQDAALRQAQTDAEQAESNLERAERLRDSGVYSLEAIESRRTAAAAASARVELARAQVRELEVRLAQTRVVAPAAGVISKRLATVGAVVQPGSELFRLIRDGQLEWLAELPAHSMAAITPGSGVRVMVDDGLTVDGVVRMVAPTLDAGTRNGLVHVALPRTPHLRAGQHARGELLVAHARTLALPESAVLMRDGYSFVYLVDNGGIARVVKVQTGARRGGMVEVAAGLPEEARVVATGAGFVKDGDLVRVAPGPQLAQKGERS